jgi:dihydrolipoamide dehydrogenase
MPDYDVIVVGAGPGGYVAAIRAAQLGMRTAVVEREELGGVCLNWGCIPSKALLRNAEVLSLFRRAEEFGIQYDNLRFDFGAAIDRSRQVVGRLTRGVGALFKKNKVQHIAGQAVLRSPTTVEVTGSGQTLDAGHIILATGARPRSVPILAIDGELVLTSREALERRDLPESAVIVGGGATGCEFADIYHAYGVQVTMVEILPHLLPNEDEEVSTALERSFTNRGINLLLGARVTGVARSGGRATLTIEAASGEQQLVCDRVMVAVGAQGNIEALGLEEVGIATDGGFIVIDAEMHTSVPTISAVGDVTGKLLLAHVASAQGVSVAEQLAGQSPPALDYQLMPRAVYCRPQVASFGLTEQAARESGRPFKVGKFPMRSNGKALGLGEPEGFSKVLVDAEHGEILGAHIIGPEATEVLAELSLARFLEGTAREVGWMVHSHPTVSETVREAALAAQGQAIHI